MRRFEGASLVSLSVDEAVSYALNEGATGLDGKPIPVKQVAGLVNIPLAVVYDIASGRRPARANELAPIIRATRCTIPADVIERDIHRIGVALPVVNAEGDPAIEQAAKSCREFGEFMTEFGVAALDHAYTKDEARDVRTKAEQLIASVYACVQQVEAAAGLSTLRKLGVAR